MQPLLIIESDVPAEALTQRSWGRILVQIDILVLHGPEKSFHENVVQGTPLSVHRDLNSFCLQQLDVVLIGELAALVAVDDLRFGLG